ncbi:DNA repair protein RecN [Caldicellulosiruptor kronotskyensis 2002]|uniref:DNA repair protein RecN n=1 Tax=Caldicellulosiruptor kronotskyensis (strain DSM 18902 / VKM B-2412 / 2002) TaxID=632348 RepID=E4SBU9_CALK2|nr:DNA repair protein RecN [Caldicellulosiruptor kronotskyensis]ADQ46222.1 DNA repair protein RecN [Caldicellulosiruptor kronotskyensis 2002]
MLKRLLIENIAIIDRLDIEFDKGLTILTGETGAGKSIIIDSLSLLLGTKFKKEIIRTGCTKACVSAVFEIEKKSTIERLTQMGISLEDNYLIVSREVYSSGKNICRVNNQFVLLSTLREITKHIFEIHGQNETHLLNDKRIQLLYIDRFCGRELEELKAEYKDLYHDYQEKKRLYEQIITKEEERERQLDLLNYQINEIESVKPQIGEDIELEKRKEIIQNSWKLKHNSEKMLDTINNTIIDSLEMCIRLANENSRFDKEFEAISERLNNVYYEIEDISFSISKKSQSYEVNKDEIEQIVDRLDKINRLKKKYGSTIEKILEYRKNLLEEREKIRSSSEQAFELKEYLSKTKERLEEISKKMSNIRRRKSEEFEKKVLEILSQLEMKNVSFYINFLERELYEEGIDEVEFLISTNVGQQLKPLSTIASGGELSRIMLAIKSIVAEKDDIELIIFDEIDSGLSGVVANRLAKLLKELSKKHQIICITHLPQVAAAADTHYYVYKEVKDNFTISNIKKLEGNEQLREIARMFSGENVTESSLLHAKQLKSQFI